MGLCLSGFLRFGRLLSVNIEIQNCTEEAFFSGFTNIFNDLLISVTVPGLFFFFRFPHN